jgi:glucose-1-phosphate adenylyltransferase
VTFAPCSTLYNPNWPILYRDILSAARQAAFDEEADGVWRFSRLSLGSILSGATVVNSVLGRGVFVHSYSVVEWSIINDHCHIHSLPCTGASRHHR